MIAELDSLYIKTRPGRAYPRIISHLLFQGRYVTTSHRWLNTVILGELKAYTYLPQIKRSVEPIFIIGTGRSGSTVLGKVMSMHSDVGFLNEPKALWYVVDPADDVNGHFGADLPARYNLGKDDVTPGKVQAAQRLYAAYLLATGATRVVDKNPEVVYRVDFVQSIFPDAKFVFLIRDGWDTVGSIVSWTNQNKVTKDGVIEDWWGLNQRKWNLMIDELVPEEPLLADAHSEIRQFTRHEDMAAVEWIVAMQRGLREMATHGKAFYRLPYERLTTQPRKTLTELLEFCELPEDPVMLSYGEQVLSPNKRKPPVPLQTVLHEPFRRTMDDLGYPESEFVAP